MEQFITDLSILLFVAGILSVLAVYLKQPVIIAYIAAGAVIGPGGFGWIKDVYFIEGISHLGITLLLFLAGLNLHPQKLLRIFSRTTLVTFLNCAASFVLAFCAGISLGFGVTESFCMGLALMFSSTILVIKLLPTTTLHHARMGAACIGVLIMEDLLAVASLAYIRCLGTEDQAIISFLILTVKLITFITVLVLFEHFVLTHIMKRVDRLHEVLFILGLAWCCGVATISYQMGLFYESGAFLAGVVLARQKISRFIADKLRPLRDFFLVLFFFTLGAKLDLQIVQSILIPAAALAILFLIMKPLLFKQAFRMTGERIHFAEEAGVRLGQLSEFSLLIALLSLEMHLISQTASEFIQLVTILTFIISSYLVVYKYPTPIGVADNLRKD